MFLELNGLMGNYILDDDYDKVAIYINYMMIASIVGFSFARLIATFITTSNQQRKLIPLEVVDAILSKFKWLLYVCLFVGILQVVFLFSIGGWATFEDYRLIAVSAQRTGYGAIAQRLSGHLAILGVFYLSFLGYKHARTGINFKQLIFCIFSVGSLNMSIAGRGWIIQTSLPYVIAYFFGIYKYRKNLIRLPNYKRDLRKICVLGIFLISIFSITGLMRNTETAEGEDKVKVFFNKFLYYTDGPKMANMVLSQYPTGSFPLEYGTAEFLGSWKSSPMTRKFATSIEHDRALSVTVKSAIPSLYYDWGYDGGVIAWGVYAFVLELICILLLNGSSIFALLLFVQLTKLLFESPIGTIFAYAVPVFEWLLILYLFRRYIFKHIPNIKQFIE